LLSSAVCPRFVAELRWLSVMPGRAQRGARRFMIATENFEEAYAEVGMPTHFVRGV